jgi:hypothetical protein
MSVVKFIGCCEHAKHLKASLEEDYEVSTDWNGGIYYGITLE